MSEQDNLKPAGHVEAYVRLEAAICEKKFRQGLAAAVWHDHRGEHCGTVSVRSLSQSVMLIHYAVLAPGSSGFAQGEKLLSLQRVQTNPHYSKPYFTCPECGTRAGQIILAQEQWSCRPCHGLGYRSQRLGRLQVLQQRYEALVQLLQPVGGEPSRPRYMHATKFAEVSAEYAALRAELKNRPRQVLARSLGLSLTATWRPAAFAPAV